ncbi:MAG: internal scaffolding protein [Microvirus sp.]|nr:MAG: internal scaffolding protein [Microvirus sp.]
MKTEPEKKTCIDICPQTRFRTPYSARYRSPMAVYGPMITKQEFAQECDINHIMAKFQKTGLIDHVNKYPGGYGDFTNLPTDYQSALNQIIQADEMFLSLPSGIRKQFENDPGQFLEFAENPANAEKMRDLGLLPSTRVSDQSVRDPAPDKNTQQSSPNLNQKPSETNTPATPVAGK